MTVPDASKAPDPAPLLLPMLLAGLLTFILTAALYGSLFAHLGERFPITMFDRGHLRVYQSVLGGDVGPLIGDLAYPVGGRAQYMGWVGIGIVGILRPIFGPLGAYTLSVWLAPALGAAVGVRLIRAVTGIDVVSAVLLSPLVALSPVVIGFLRCGQAAKSHVWAVELALLAVLACLARPGAKGPLLALAGAAALVGLQAPPLGLVLPFAVVVPFGIHLVVSVRSRGGRGALRACAGQGAAVLLALAIGLAGPAACTASGMPRMGGGPVVRRGADDPVYLMLPAQNPDSSLGGVATPSVAEPIGMFVGPQRDPAGGPLDASVHVTYIGIPALVLAVLALRRRGRGAAFGAALAGVGVAVAMGPYLSWGTAFLGVGGLRLPGPAYPLRLLHYPLGDSGLWYRALVLVGPGLAVLLASALTRFPARNARLLALGATVLVLADTLRATAPLLPIPSAPVEGRATLVRIAADPTPGAVLDLPFERSQRDAERALLRAGLHRRPSSLVTAHSLFAIYPHLERLDAALRVALAGDSLTDGPRANPAATLRALGFAWVVLDTEGSPPPLPNQGPTHNRRVALPPVTEAELTRALGEPIRTATLRFWTLAASPEASPAREPR